MAVLLLGLYKDVCSQNFFAKMAKKMKNFQGILGNSHDFGEEKLMNVNVRAQQIGQDDLTCREYVKNFDSFFLYFPAFAFYEGVLEAFGVSRKISHHFRIKTEKPCIDRVFQIYKVAKIFDT